METLKPMALWRVELAMRAPNPGAASPVEYTASRLESGYDPDDVTSKAVATEKARQLGTLQAGGVEHKVIGVRKVRRIGREA